jgi:hypothetical protein
MTKEERRAEKIRMLVQSGSLFLDAARELQAGTTPGLSTESALQCVFAAHLSNEVQGIRHELAVLNAALKHSRPVGAEVGK